MDCNAKYITFYTFWFLITYLILGFFLQRPNLPSLNFTFRDVGQYDAMWPWWLHMKHVRISLLYWLFWLRLLFCWRFGKLFPDCDLMLLPTCTCFLAPWKDSVNSTSVFTFLGLCSWTQSLRSLSHPFNSFSLIIRSNSFSKFTLISSLSHQCLKKPSTLTVYSLNDSSRSWKAFLNFSLM